MYGSVGLAAVAPFILFWQLEWKEEMALLGGLWVLVGYLVLEGLESRNKRRAANIQEQFDTNVLGLPWNETLVGRKVPLELIHSASRSFTGDRGRLRNWYPDTSGVPFPLDVLLCQRANLVWDWCLRRHYAWGIAVLTSICFGSGVALAATTGQTVNDYILGVFLPSLLAYLHGIEVSKSHFRTANEKEDLGAEATALWESGLKALGALSEQQCRRIQDRIFLLRKTGPLVPDKWYDWLRSRYDVDMRLAALGLKDQLKNAMASKRKQ